MKKKVAFLLKNLDGGGAERVASNIMLNLSNEKYDKYLILDNEDIIVYEYDAKLITLDIVNTNNKIGRIINFFKKVIEVRKIKKEYEFDVVISFLSGSNLINIMTKKNEKNVISIRNYMSKEHKDNLRGKILVILSKALYKYTDVVTVVSREAAVDLIDNFSVNEDNIEVIYNPYDLEKIHKKSIEEIDEEYKHIFNKPTIINVGRLCEQKGQIYLIEIIKKILEEKDINLVILGKGELEEELKSKVKEYGIEENVYFLGFQENPYKYISKSKIMLMTSLFEGFPNVMLEAMACGIPIISTDCKSGPKEIMIEKCKLTEKLDYSQMMDYGWLIPDISENKIDEVIKIACDHVNELLDDNYLYKDCCKKSLIRSNDFKIDKIIKYWENIINS